MSTTEQRRAADAWKKASEGVLAYKKDYVNDAKGLPALIMSSGLLQVMAFLEQKNDNRYGLFGQQLRDWLASQVDTPSEFERFMEFMVNECEPRQFQLVTKEAMAWLKWLRHFAPAVRGES